MLSRVANTTYWMNRYIERAENYARFMDVNFNLALESPSDSMEQWKPLVIITGDWPLYESLYEKVETEDAGDGGEFGHSSGNMRFMMSVPENKVFIDLENKKILEQREFMTRIFLIKADMPENKWKISGEQKMILDYPCIEATHTDTAGVITRVWFAPSITVQSGPAKFCNLPGLVLEVNIKDGDRVYLAQSINFDPLDKNRLKKPKEGKKISMAEFDKIVAEKMKERGMDGTGGIHGGRTMTIKIKK